MKNNNIWFNDYCKKNYLLRLQSRSFLMVVDKNTGEYKNIYAEDAKESREYLEILAKDIEKHPAIKEEEDVDKCV